MTLRLVDASAEPAEPELSDAAYIVEMAIGFIAEIEAGEHPGAYRALVLIEREGGMRIEAWGRPTSPYEVIGLLEVAKLNVYAERLADDD